MQKNTDQGILLRTQNNKFFKKYFFNKNIKQQKIPII